MPKLVVSICVPINECKTLVLSSEGFDAATNKFSRKYLSSAASKGSIMPVFSYAAIASSRILAYAVPSRLLIISVILFASTSLSSESFSSPNGTIRVSVSSLDKPASFAAIMLLIFLTSHF